MYVLLGLFAAYLGACWALAGSYLSPPRRLAVKPEWMSEKTIAGVPCFVTPRLAQGEPGTVVFVLAHGLRGTRGAFTATAWTLHENGYDAILPAMSGQDANPKTRIGFGGDESDEMAAIAEEARGMAGTPKVVLGGVSMGGAAAWLASAKAPWVSGTITESAFADFPGAAKVYLDKAFPGASFILRPVILFGELRSGLKTSEIRPVDSAAKYRGMSVVLHAQGDRTIPESHGERLAQAVGVPLKVFPGAAHANCREADPGGYDRLFLDLARRVAATGSGRVTP